MKVFYSVCAILVTFSSQKASHATLVVPIKDSEFYWNNQLLTWSNHEKFAHEHGLALASIKNVEEQYLIENFFDNNGIGNRRGTFLGGKRYNYDGSFYWLDGSSLEVFTKWHSDEPYYWGKTSCVRLVFYETWGWRSGDCEKKLYGLYRKMASKSPSHSPIAQLSHTPSFKTSHRPSAKVSYEPSLKSIQPTSSELSDKCMSWCVNTSIEWSVKCQFSTCHNCSHCFSQFPSIAPSQNTTTPSESLSITPSTTAGLTQIGSIFLLNEDLTYFVEHRRIARKLGYELASIQNEEEDLFLQQFFKNRDFDVVKPIYIGAIRKQDGSFRWIDGSNFNSFQNWINGQPNSVHQACLSVEYKSEWGWGDTGCDRLLKGLYRRKIPMDQSPLVTPSLSPTLHGQCRAYCVELTFLEWDEKCRWSDCVFCGNCMTSSTINPSTSPTLFHCKDHCFTSPTKSWAHKCSWFDCDGCSACKTTVPSVDICPSFCETVPIQWTEKCKWDPCNSCSKCLQSPMVPSSLPTNDSTNHPTSKPSRTLTLKPSKSTIPTSVPSAPSCKSHCYASPTKSWSKKCKWFDCNGCKECHTAAPSIHCPNWCDTIGRSWTEKCGWAPCDACKKCDALTSLKPSLIPFSTPTSTPTGITCKEFCFLVTHTWAQKCEWENCRACENCVTPPPSLMYCKPWCENSMDPWEKKCDWPLSCGGCPACRNLA